MRRELDAKVNHNPRKKEDLKWKREEAIKATGLLNMKRGREWAEELKDFVYCI